MIEDSKNSFELVVKERILTSQSAGDTEFIATLQVKSHSATFTAKIACWVGFSQLERFYEELKRMEEDRKGTATLVSMSPDELELEIRLTDSSGHVAAFGHVGSWIGSDISCQWSQVSFGIPFQPSRLSELASEFSELARM